LVSAAPMIENRDVLPLGRDEFTDIDGIGEGMLTDTLGQIVVTRAAIIGRKGRNMHHGRVQLHLRGGLYHVLEPAVQRFGQFAGNGWRGRKADARLLAAFEAIEANGRGQAAGTLPNWVKPVVENEEPR